MGNPWFRYRRRMRTLLISNGLRTSEQNSRPGWRYTLHGVRQERGRFIHGVWHVSHWYWETPKIRVTFQDNCTMNCHSILGWILRFSDGWETHFRQCLSRNLQSILNLTKMKHQTRCSCMNMKVINAPSLVHLLLNRRCYFVLCQARFLIWSGGSQSFWRIIWIFSTCMQKWAMISAQKCSLNSKIRQIPLCL